MKSMRILRFLLPLALLLPFSVKAQDTLVLINGNTKIVDIANLNQRMLYVSFRKTESNRKKLKALDLRDVYSVAWKDSAKVITYFQDSASGLDMPLDEMTSYVKGEQYAVQHYKAPWVTACGIVTGAAGPLVINFFFGMLVPAVYTGTIGVIPISTRKLAKTEPVLYADPYFVQGYKQRAKRKKVMNAIYGSLIGLGAAAITTTVFLVTNPQ
jgi:hypothetical protein